MIIQPACQPAAQFLYPAIISLPEAVGVLSLPSDVVIALAFLWCWSMKLVQPQHLVDLLFADGNAILLQHGSDLVDAILLLPPSKNLLLISDRNGIHLPPARLFVQRFETTLPIGNPDLLNCSSCYLLTDCYLAIIQLTSFLLFDNPHSLLEG